MSESNIQNSAPNPNFLPQQSMKLYSTYLKKEFDIPSYTVEEQGIPREVPLHGALQELLYNGQSVAELNPTVHYSVVIAEENRYHYAVICAISDKAGRRVEGFGEAVPNTLGTQIAGNYPAATAKKRAFDDACMLYFGFPSGVYTDEQLGDSCAPAELPAKTPKENAPGQPVATQPVVPTVNPTTGQPPMQPAAQTVAQNPVQNSDQPAPATRTRRTRAQAAPPAQQNTPIVPGTSATPANAPNVEAVVTSSANTQAPVQTASNDTVAASSAPDAVVQTPRHRAATTAAPNVAPAPPVAQPQASPQGQPVIDDGGDVVLTCGTFRNKEMTVRQAFQERRTSVGWVAYKMIPRHQATMQQQEAAKKYLASVGYTKEKYLEEDK